MSNYTVSYSTQEACSQPSVTIPPPPFLPIDSTSVSICTISNYLPNADIILSACCDLNTTAPNRSSNSHNQTLTSGYDADNCAWRYCNMTGPNGVSSFESCLNRTTSTSVEGKCFSSNGKVATSEGSSMYWKFGKKKKTVSAALLIALGVAGVFIS